MSETPEKSSLYKVLEAPWLYGLVQNLVAPGHIGILNKHIDTLFDGDIDDAQILDVGCGPESWLSRVGRSPVGLDISRSYVGTFTQSGGRGVVASAAEMPFADDSFRWVWSIGLFHHIPDSMVVDCLKECARTCQPGGQVIIMDAVLPRNPVFRPLAHIIRRLDRGQFMRTQDHLMSLVPNAAQAETKRFTYAATGLEMLLIKISV